VAKINVYLADIGDYSAMNEAYDTFFSGAGFGATGTPPHVARGADLWDSTTGWQWETIGCGSPGGTCRAGQMTRGCLLEGPGVAVRVGSIAQGGGNGRDSRR
jgi:hypothetical protein